MKSYVTNFVALDKNTGKIVYVDEYKNNQECICIDCKGRMIKCSEDDEHHKVRPYFRHYDSNECKGGSGESYLHKIAKEVFLELKEYTLPKRDIVVMNKYKVLSDEEKVVIDKVELEKVKKVSDSCFVKPDIEMLCHTEDGVSKRVFIEIKNSHAVSGMKKANLRKLGVETIEIDVKPLLKGAEFPTREEVKSFIVNGLCRTVIYDKEIDEAEQRYNASKFSTNGGKYGCPLTDYKVSVDRSVCKNCACFLGIEKGHMVCTGKSCYTNPNQILDSNSKLEDRLDTVLIPQDETKGFRLTNKVCPKCGRVMKLGVGLKGRTFNGVLVRVNKDNDYMYLTCMNDTCDAEPQVLMCPYDKKIVPVYSRDDKGKVISDEYGNPFIKHTSKHKDLDENKLTVNTSTEVESRIYQKCQGHAKSLVKQGDGGFINHVKGACFIGCSDSESDVNNLPYGQKESCDASLTIFDSEDDMLKLNYSEEVLALDGVDLYFDDYPKAKKIIEKIRSKK